MSSDPLIISGASMIVFAVRMCAPLFAFLQTNVPAPLSAHSPSPPAEDVHCGSRLVPSKSSDTQVVVVGEAGGAGLGEGAGVGRGSACRAVQLLSQAQSASRSQQPSHS